MTAFFALLSWKFLSDVACLRMILRQFATNHVNRVVFLWSNIQVGMYNSTYTWRFRIPMTINREIIYYIKLQSIPRVRFSWEFRNPLDEIITKLILSARAYAATCWPICSSCTYLNLDVVVFGLYIDIHYTRVRFHVNMVDALKIGLYTSLVEFHYFIV